MDRTEGVSVSLRCTCSFVCLHYADAALPARLPSLSIELESPKNCMAFVLYVLDKLMVVCGIVASCLAYKTTDTMIQILIQRFKVGGAAKMAW